MSVESVHMVIAFAYFLVWLLIGQTAKRPSPTSSLSKHARPKPNPPLDRAA
jgi:hypothetical protein